MGTLVMNNYWKFRGVQNVAAVGHGLVARASQSMAENRLQMKADIAYILEIWAARINAGEKVTIGDPTGERTEIYLDSTNGDRPTIDMYNTAGVLQSRWHYGGFDFFDALGAIATRLATTTEDKTITVGSGKNYATIQEAVNSLPMLIRHDIIIEVYAGAYAETVLIEGFIGPGTISVQNHTGDTVNVVSFSVTSCSLYLLSIKGFTVTKTTGHAVKIYGSNFVSCDTLAITDSAAFYAGIYFYRGCRGLITGCTVSNHGEAISIQNSCDVTITSCAGSGNDVGIHVHSSSAHDGGSNTITGTTPRRTESGGEIIPSTGLIGSSHGGSYVPAGAVMEFAGSTAPTGYKLCDGSAISRTTYADLYAVIGTTYGTGDGSTTFNLPNLKGRIPVGYNGAETEFNALGETGGAKTHTLSNDELPVLYLNGGYVDSDFGLAGARNGIVVTQAAANGFPITTNVNTGGGGGEHNNLQPYIVLNYIIKL
jgi:microcystin-dependent protein